MLVGFLCKLSSQIKEEVCQPLAKKKYSSFRNQCIFQSLRSDHLRLPQGFLDGIFNPHLID